MPLSFIKSSGSIISEDFCQALSTEVRAEYVKDASFGIRKIDEHIGDTFEKLRERWEQVRTPIHENKFDNTQLREKWLLPFFRALGFEPVYQKSSLKSDAGIDFNLTHYGWSGDDAPAIHMVVLTQDLDLKDKNSRTHPNKSPQDVLQNFLNTSAHSWAVLTNGVRVRVLRDFHHSITKGFIEFDLDGIFETANTEQFRVLFRLMHRSRFEGQLKKKADDGEETTKCRLEKFHELSKETGVQIGNKLRDQVRDAIEILGNGFTEHLKWQELTDKEVKEIYAEIMNVIYRILFLLFAEQKGWLPVRNDMYARTYSINHLRNLAERGLLNEDRHDDLWEGLKITFKLVAGGYTFPEGDKINAFGGQLFSQKKLRQTLPLQLKNKFLLRAVFSLSYFEDAKQKLRQKINYTTLAIDALGSVYESLLDYEPRVLKQNETIRKLERPAGSFVLDDRSSERKTTGSYYTDSRLVAQLIDSALTPVIENALNSATTAPEKRKALLDLKVCDMACGSGAFLIAALEKLGETLARIDMGDEELPTEEQLRKAKRDVLIHCIYGVDLNPMALELAKFSLWITAAMPDLPLTFLDHKLKCGNSLIGATPELIINGIPEEAYNVVTLDNAIICAELKKKVRRQKEQMSRANEPTVQYGMQFMRPDGDELLRLREALNKHKQEEADEVDRVEEEYVRLVKAERKFKDWLLADIWTSAFFITKNEIDFELYPTNVTLENLRENQPLKSELIEKVLRTAEEYHFFHWYLEYPEVFTKGGFDCLLGNPPWDKVQPEEKKFFAAKNPDIAKAKGVKRKALIKNLENSNPTLNAQWQEHKRAIECGVKFFKNVERYALTGRGRLNTYSLFSECCLMTVASKGRVGIITPTGICTDDTTQYFFKKLVSEEKLISIYDFENKKGLFNEVHRMFKFCLLTFGCRTNNQPADFLFYAKEIEDLKNEEKHFKLSGEELLLINPNTGTAPLFRSKKDAELTKRIYRQIPILINEVTKENSWKIKLLQGLFNMTSDSKLFKEKKELENEGFELEKNIFVKEQKFLPLYEGKMIYHYNHRYGTFLSADDDDYDDESKDTSLPEPTREQYLNPNFEVMPRYWVHEGEMPLLVNAPEFAKHAFQGSQDIAKKAVQLWVAATWYVNFNEKEATKLANNASPNSNLFALEIELENTGKNFPLDKEELNEYENTQKYCDLLDSWVEKRKIKWFLGFRDITNAANERTSIFTVLPYAPVSHKLPLMFLQEGNSQFSYLVQANFCCLVLDYIVRQKLSGTSFTFFVIKQIPIIPLKNYSLHQIEEIRQRVLKLTYNSYSLKPFADELGYYNEPFEWNEQERFQLRCELDAIYGHIYGLTREEFDYILDTFPITRKKDLQKYKTYRTKETILKYFDEMWWVREEKEKAKTVVTEN